MEIFRNSRKIDAYTRAFSDHKAKLQAVIDQFKDLGIGTIDNRDQMLSALGDPKRFIDATIQAQLDDQALQVGSFKMKKSSVVKMLDLKEQNEFINAVQAVKDVPNCYAAFTAFGRVYKSQPDVDKKLLAKFIDRLTVNAVTSNEKKMASHLFSIIDNITELVSMGVPVRALVNNALLNKVLTGSGGWDDIKLMINPHFFKTYSEV